MNIKQLKQLTLDTIWTITFVCSFVYYLGYYTRQRLFPNLTNQHLSDNCFYLYLYLCNTTELVRHHIALWWVKAGYNLVVNTYVVLSITVRELIMVGNPLTSVKTAMQLRSFYVTKQ